jgi:Flp pilus assembly protein TadG
VLRTIRKLVRAHLDHTRTTLVRFKDDDAGSYLVVTGLLLPVLVGIVGLGTEGGLWYMRHNKMQAAADSAAISAATEYYLQRKAETVTPQARAVSATYGFTHGTNNVEVAVNRPPSSGPYASDQKAVEVTIREPQTRLLSVLFDQSPLRIGARAVALGMGGKGCVITLDPSASGAATLQGTAAVELSGCSLYDNSASATALAIGGSGTLKAESVSIVGSLASTSGITTTDGIATGQPAASDPYADASFGSFTGCDKTNLNVKSDLTVDPGVYCNGIQVNSGATLTLNPGIYYINQGDLKVNGGATVNGTGVTLVFTSSNGHNYASATINGGANVNLSAPTSGPTAGIVLFGDRNMTVDTPFKLNGGSTELFEGAIYLPKGDVSFAGGAASTNGCLQLIANKATFVGNANFAINCEGKGTRAIASALAKLTE